jgi:hypothetical protein
VIAVHEAVIRKLESQDHCDHLKATVYSSLQLGLDTFYWNPIQHVFLWGSILAWFVVLPITSSSALYIAGIGVFRFDFLGVFYEVFQTATFWMYWPLAAVIALGPTITFRTLLLDLRPTLVDDVRLKMKKEGRKLFRRALLKKKIPRISISLAGVKERTGYAFSHQGGFGRLILSGRMFGGMSEAQVRKERERRISTLIVSPSTSPRLSRSIIDPTVQTLPAETLPEVHPQTNPEPMATTVDAPAPIISSSELKFSETLVASLKDQKSEEDPQTSSNAIDAEGKMQSTL